MNKIEFNSKRIGHWDEVAKKWANRKGLGKYYQRRLAKVFKFLVSPGMNVLELGCGEGDLLAALQPAKGIGVDISAAMIKLAKQKHPQLDFYCLDAAEIELPENYDFIILSDLINDVWDVQKIFEVVRRHSLPHTRIILNFYSRLWEMPLWLSQKLKLSKPTPLQNWLTCEDIYNLLALTDLEAIRHWVEILSPVNIPFITFFCNRFLVKLWPFRLFALSHFLVLRQKAGASENIDSYSISVVVPARNESGNISKIFSRMPKMGKGLELIFVEGHSKDDTYEVIQRESRLHPELNCKLIKQSGSGKGDAVRLGFENAAGDMLMILDADLTVPPEDLPLFYRALASGKGELINGVRLVYPREKEAMRFINLIGNKFFSLAFSWILGQPIKDTLCGTKVLFKRDYDHIKKSRSYFGDFDPFGDFDLIFGATKTNLKIVDIPIRYQERVYGQTNIQRWQHGWLLLKMIVFAALRLKFI